MSVMLEGITLVPDGININGKYFSVVSGYQSTHNGQVYIAYADLLAVDYICSRSKKILLAFVLVGSLVSVAVANIGILRLTGSSVFMGIVLLCLACLLAFVFSNQAYIEFTYIGGVVRVPCGGMGKANAMRFIAEVRNRKAKSPYR